MGFQDLSGLEFLLFLWQYTHVLYFYYCDNDMSLIIAAGHLLYY